MTLNLCTLYSATGTAKLADLPAYEMRVKELVPPGADVTLTGPGPVWLYLRLAHTLHGRVPRSDLRQPRYRPGRNIQPQSALKYESQHQVQARLRPRIETSIGR